MKKFILLIFSLLLFPHLSIYPQQPFKIAIHYSDATEATESNKLIEKITYWELLFLDNKIKYDVIYDTDLESGVSAEDYCMIIFPYSRVLSSDCYNSLIEYIEKGGSVMAFGEFGTFNEKLFLRGYDRFEKLFGVIHIGNISKKEMSSYIDISDYLPITKDISKKNNIQITARNSPALVEAISQNTISIGTVKMVSEKDEIEKSIIVLKNNLHSKLLWFSFDPTEIIGGREEIKSVEQIIKNAILWFSQLNIH